MAAMVSRVNDDDLPTAVVVIHGIGSQMPMDTLRALVDTVFGEASGATGSKKVQNKVDRYSTFLDLRRLVLSRGRGHGRVDFYELYWAPTLGSGTVGAVLTWGWRILRRRPDGEQMRHVVTWVRGMLVALLVVFVGVAVGGYVLAQHFGWSGFLGSVVPVLGFLLAVPRAVARRILTEVLADASRWFAPGPKDIHGRDKVRRLGMQLLTELHGADDSGQLRYGRIVVIGHSLGSVIAYDVLRLAFDKLREPSREETEVASGPAERAEPSPPAVQLAERQPGAWHFEVERDRLGDATDPVKATRDFQYVQRQLLAEQRLVGSRWRVTDFISAGSPLTHAADLWGSKVADFPRRLSEGEFPTCPPLGAVQHSEERLAARQVSVPVGADKRPIAFYRRDPGGPLIAHEASVFALTRWTNLYIPMERWLGGDPIGGPIAPVFGPGVRDIPVRVSASRKAARRIMWMPVAAHTWYWKRDPTTTRLDVTDNREPRDAVRMLERVVALREPRPTPYRPRKV